MCFATAAGGVFGGESPRVWIELRDKGPSLAGGPGDRTWENAPVHPPYLDSLRAAGVSIGAALKWQNKVSGTVAPERLAALRALPMVRRVEALPRKAKASLRPEAREAPPSPPRKPAAVDFGAYQPVFDSLQAGRLRDAVQALGKKPGEGVRIAVIDAGFSVAHDAFAHLRARGFRDQWDFVAGTSTAATATPVSGNHGALVLSPLAARSSGLEGLAPDAEYMLYRAEDESSEGYVEEDYVAAAIERAVDSGAHVINISLGYRYDFDGSADVPFAAMDGRTRPASLAALGAARRGVLVAVAMGNEGATRDGLPSISSPADADSIFSVSLLTFAQTACGYASGGPAADGRVKPEVSSSGVSLARPCEMATVQPASLSATAHASGTSLGAPVIAGILALLRQLHPQAPAQAIRAALIATAGRAANPDSAAGYGLARAWNAHLLLGGAPVAVAPATEPRPGSGPRHRVGGAPRDARGRVTAERLGPATPVFPSRE